MCEFKWEFTWGVEQVIEKTREYTYQYEYLVIRAKREWLQREIIASHEKIMGVDFRYGRKG